MSKKRSADEFDLRGKTPESWLCIDCGINTAPGMPSRVEMERRYRTWTAINKLSGENPPVAEFTVKAVGRVLL